MTLINDLLDQKDREYKLEWDEKLKDILNPKINPMIKIPRASEQIENHDYLRIKLFEIYVLIEQLVKDDRGNRIVDLCHHLDSIVKDYASRGNLTHVPLINLFQMLIDKNIKGYKLLRVIDWGFKGNAIAFARSVRQDNNLDEHILTLEEIKRRADESLAECLKVI